MISKTDSELDLIDTDIDITDLDLIICSSVSRSNVKVIAAWLLQPLTCATDDDTR